MNYDYDDETLKSINENADLLSYVSQSLELEQRGDNYYAHCIKHDDRTASLCFSKEKNMYHCFSCGLSGKTIGYLMDYEGMRFGDAVEKAARLANVDMSKMCQSKTISFLRKLKQSSEKKKETYVHEILPETTITKYLDMPPTEWLEEGITANVMREFGIRVDNYGNRIVYPVRDAEGRLINVKGRTRYDNYKALKIAKYINYFDVGVMDYFQSLDITMPFIQEQHEIIIFESIKSTMKCFGWGYKNCVSAEKHTLTDEQISLLVNLKVNVVFAYDSDVNYRDSEVMKDIDKLRRITNVYIIEDRDKLLGGAEAKNSPADLGKETWEELYSNKRKVV